MRQLGRFEETLAALLAASRSGADSVPRLCGAAAGPYSPGAGGESGIWPLRCQRATAGRRSSVLQALMQFICGYHDADLRDSTGLGHGRLIARHACPPVRDRWLPRCWLGRCPGSRSPNRTAAARCTPPSPPPPRTATGLGGQRHENMDQPAERGRRVHRVLHRSGRAPDRGRHRLARRGPASPHALPAGLWVVVGRTAVARCAAARRDMLGRPVRAWICCASISLTTGRWSPRPRWGRGRRLRPVAAGLRTRRAAGAITRPAR